MNNYAKLNWTEYNRNLVNRGRITFYNLPLRALQIFFQSILRLLQQDLKVPHDSLFCKRAKEASSSPPRLSKKRPAEILIDSSGLKVRGEGEWKVKLHIAADPKTQELIAIEVTSDYLISQDGQISHDKITSFINTGSSTSKDLWL